MICSSAVMPPSHFPEVIQSHSGPLRSLTLLSCSHTAPAEGRVGPGADHPPVTRFPKIPIAPYIRSHLWLGNSQKDKVRTTPEFFFWQPTIGHMARFKVTQAPHGRKEGGAGADSACSELYSNARARVPEVDNTRKATSGSRHPRDSRKPFTVGLSGLFFSGPLSWHRKAFFPGP